MRPLNPSLPPAAPRVRPAAAATARDNLRGALLMAAAMTAFTVNDVLVKYVTQTLPLYQTMVLRGMGVMIGVWAIAARQGGLELRVARSDWRALGLRTVGEVASTVLFLNALTMLAITDLSAIMQSLPLLVTLAAAVFFGERLGWRRLLAIGIGLAGVMMILRPGTSAFTLWSLVGFASVLMVVLRDLATRLFTHGVATTTIAFYASVSVTLTAAVLSLGQGWRVPTLAEAGLIALAATSLSVGYVTVVASMRIGEIAFVAPFRYVSLLVAGVLGVIVFGDWPDGWTLAGGSLVVCAGLYSFWRERRLATAG